jgi:transcriptional regulator GlxA family with amidase domain
MKIGIPIFPGFDPLDVIGPFEIFSWMARIVRDQTIKVAIISSDLGLVISYSNLSMMPHETFEECERLDVLFVPGGSPDAVHVMMDNQGFISFLQQQAQSSTYVSSVCVGALLLAAAGLLDGFKATTHWAFLSELQRFPKIKVVNGYPRYVLDGNRITGGGISSGLDQALKMVALISRSDEVAKQIQLTIQYNPRPPYKDGDPCVADYQVYERYIKGSTI